MAVRCSVCNDMTSEKNAEIYNGKCPVCHKHIKGLNKKVSPELRRAMEEDGDIRKGGIKKPIIVGTPNPTKRDLISRIMNGDIKSVPGTTIPVFTNSAEGKSIMPIMTEEQYAEYTRWKKADEELRLQMDKAYMPSRSGKTHGMEKLRELKENADEAADKLKKQGIDTSSLHIPMEDPREDLTEDYDAMMAELEPSREEQKNIYLQDTEALALYEWKYRDLASKLSNDELMTCYRDAIEKKTQRQTGMSFIVQNLAQLKIQIRVFETEIGNRLAKASKKTQKRKGN